MAGVESINLHPPDWDRNYGDLGDNLEEEDEEEYLPSPIFSWSPFGRSKCQAAQLHCETLVIALGAHASTFITAHTPDWPMVAGILLPEADFSACNLISDHTNLASPGSTLTMKQDTIVLRQPRLIENDARSFDWVECIFGRIVPRRVLVLCTMSEGAYSRMCPGPKESPLLRSLHTSKATPAARQVCPLLQNWLGGTSAAVLTHCEVNELDASLFVSIDSLHAPVATIVAFEPALVLLASCLAVSKAVSYEPYLARCQLRGALIKNALPDVYL